MSKSKRAHIGVTLRYFLTHRAACKERIILLHLKLAERVSGQCGTQDTRDHFANSSDVMLRRS